MPSNPYNAYLEASISTAEPIELVRILYRAALDSVYDARTELAAGNIQGRSKAVSKAVSILRELSFSLNPEAGPTLARNLVELYDYMQRRLLDANLDQSDEALAEVAGLLTTMTEAWEKINPAAVTHSSAKA
jgi:flagellar protein FliS